MDWTDINVTPGTRASDRLPPALGEGRFRIHMDGLAEAFCAAGNRLSAGALHPEKGPWQRLFHQEPAFLFAEILTFRADDAAFSFENALDYEPLKAVRLLSDLAKKLHHWVGRIRTGPLDTFRDQLDQLNVEADLERVLAELAQYRPTALLKGIEAAGLAPQLASARGGIAEARAMKHALETAHRMLRNAVAALQPQARAAFEMRLKSKRIEPVLGLLLAEIKVSGRIEDRINAIVPRHTRFFYEDIIGQKPRPATPETVLLDLTAGPQPSFLPAGSRLEARLPDNTVQSFATDAGVHLNPAKVTAVATLSYETDPDVSFNAAFNAITGVTATYAQGGDVGSGKMFNAGAPAAIDMGLDIYSTTLELAEGQRKITVQINLSPPTDLPAISTPYRDGEERPKRGTVEPELVLALRADPALIAAFCAGPPESAIHLLAFKISDTARRRNVRPSLWLIYEVLARNPVPNILALRLLLMRIAGLCIIHNIDFPKGRYWRDIFAQIARGRTELTGQNRDPNSAMSPMNVQQSGIFRAFSALPDGAIDNAPVDVFQKLLGDAFDIRISTAQGMVRPGILHVAPSDQGAPAGLCISMALDDSMPAIAGLAPGAAPKLSLRMAGSAVVCPVSFFERYRVESIDISVQVAGLKTLAAFSDDGLVATDQTFLPFGIQPDDGATFVAGAPEMARKSVTHVGISLDWTDLPDQPGGLSTHYESYGRGVEAPKPQLSVDYLSGDGWKAVKGGPAAMLESDPITDVVTPGWRYHGAVTGHTQPAHGVVKAKEFASRQTIRAGIVRLRLSGTAGGFHANRYPLALVDAMRPRLNPLRQRVLPPKPFVPKIGRFSLSYTATDTIEVAAPDSARTGDSIVQVGPFGQVEVFPQRMLRPICLFPERFGFGQLFIQLTGAHVTGPTVLCFEMAQSGHLRVVPASNPVTWHYLSPLGWQRLPGTAISSDTTAGLMRSGLVSIDLPEDAARHSPEMPVGGVWIAAIAQGQRLDDFPQLERVKVNGVWASARDTNFAPGASASRVWTFNPARPDIAGISEIVTPAAIHPPETEQAFVTRVGERLKHRGRAVTPWDIERLVLEAFPEVWMANCLPHTRRTTPMPQPGYATLVVARRALVHGTNGSFEPSLFDVATLSRIKAFVTKIGSNNAQLEVVNPSFERLQVRAKLDFEPERENGAMAQQLKKDLAAYLSVWTADETLGRFGWSLNIRALQAHILAQPYVRALSEFSVLHLAGDDAAVYRLADTARGAGAVLRATRPWALPLSTRDHVLTVETDLQQEPAAPTGISRLTVGDMLVVGEGS